MSLFNHSALSNFPWILPLPHLPATPAWWTSSAHLCTQLPFVTCNQSSIYIHLVHTHSVCWVALCRVRLSNILLPLGYQPCLFLVLLICLSLVKDLSFLFLTKVSALALLIPFCPLRMITRFLSLLPCLSPAVLWTGCLPRVQETGELSPYVLSVLCCNWVHTLPVTIEVRDNTWLASIFLSHSITPSHRELLSDLNMTVPVTFRQVLCAY